MHEASRLPESGTLQPTGVAWFSDVAAWIDRVHGIVTDVAVALLICALVDVVGCP